MRRLYTVVLAVLTILYPFAVYFGLQQFEARWLLPMLLVLLSLRLATEQKIASSKKIWIGSAVLLLLIALAVNSEIALKLYPLLVNLGFFVIFMQSLFFPPTVIERLARLSEPTLSPAGVAYTRQVTKIWCGFFVLNGTVSAITALWASAETWALYNGFIAYMLMGLLFAGEYLIRMRVKK